jgi:hypothetical protein
MNPWEEYQQPAEPQISQKQQVLPQTDAQNVSVPQDQNAPWLEYGSQESQPQATQDTPPAPVDKMEAVRNKLLENLLRPAARVTRTGLSGIASIADPVNMALGVPLASDQIKLLFDKATGGFAAPRNTTEQLVDTAGELFTGGGIFGKGATLAAKGGGKIAQAAGKAFGVETGQQAAGLAVASTAMPVAQAATQQGLDVLNVASDSKLRDVANIGVGLGAGVLGGVAGTKAANIPVNLKNWRIKSTLPEAQTNLFGRAKVANQTIKDLETKGISPQEIDAELKGDAGIGLDPIDVSKSNISNIQDLAQIAASRKILQNSFDVREQRIIKAQNSVLQGITPDENALGQISNQYLEGLKNKMQTTAKPMYDKAFSIVEQAIIDEKLPLSKRQELLQQAKGFKEELRSPSEIIPLNSKFINSEGDEIVLQNVLSRPDIKQALTKSRQAAINAEGTSASKFFRKATNSMPDNHPVVLHNLQSYLRRNSGNLDKLIIDADEASLMAKRSDILQFLDDGLPGYKDARNTYSADLEELMKAQKGTKGIIANLQSDKGADAMNKLYRLSPTEISKVKSQLIAISPEKYSSAVKSFVDQKISTLRENQTLASLVKNPQEAAKLKAMFPSSKTYEGFSKALTYIEKTKPVQDALKRALDQDIKSAPLTESIAQGENILGKGIKAVPRAAGRVFIDPLSKKISSNLMLQEGITGRSVKSVDVKQAETMVKYAFTDEGRQLFQQLAKTTKKVDVDNLMTQIYLQSGFLTTLTNSKGGSGNLSLISDANAEEPNMSEEQIRRQLIQQHQQYPVLSDVQQINPQEINAQAKQIKQRYYKD